MPKHVCRHSADLKLRRICRSSPLSWRLPEIAGSICHRRQFEADHIIISLTFDNNKNNECLLIQCSLHQPWKLLLHIANHTTAVLITLKAVATMLWRGCHLCSRHFDPEISRWKQDCSAVSMSRRFNAATVVPLGIPWFMAFRPRQTICCLRSAPMWVTLLAVKLVLLLNQV